MFEFHDFSQVVTLTGEVQKGGRVGTGKISTQTQLWWGGGAKHLKQFVDVLLVGA